MTDQSIAQIAAALTKAQRRSILAIKPGEERRAIDFSGSAARNLRWPTSRRPSLLAVTITGAGTVAWYKHTPAGEEVRAYLISEGHDHGRG